ncbi:DUF1929 domain-containing protein [Thalassotalea euphylliae]|uniref:DUF1929 domain-containing protein n=1 Tax=Thalassotalea euphylliae TaxID=1655234 RepID=A0A3E0TP24_9GAMM|nr:discoidin domain-containing protein [Thalassotalea euphylliae]REL26361.1 DUF1929 domain-containing protein [Thalassotalea euphylliae]
MTKLIKSNRLITPKQLLHVKQIIPAAAMLGLLYTAQSVAISPPHHTPKQQATANTVTLWQNQNLTGDSEIFSAGVYFAQQVHPQVDNFQQISDKQTSSVTAGNNAVGWLCQNASTNPTNDGSIDLGLCHVFTSETVNQLNSHNFNNATSAIVVAEKTKTRLATGLTAWSNLFSGNSQEFSAGSYDVLDIVNGVGNDAISSIKVAPGFLATLCTNGIDHAKTPLSNGVPEGAQCRTFPAGSYGNLSQHNLDDIVTYLAVNRVDTNPARIGTFGPVRQWPFSAINQYLLTDGRVMFNESSPDDGNPTTGEYAIWDPATETIVQESTFAPGSDLFCSAFVHLPNGNLLAAAAEGGGTTTTIAVEYSVDTGEWTLAQAMNWGRYYPTATVTPEGNVLVTGGNDVFGNFYGQGVIAVTEPEVYENGAWRSLPGANIPFTNFRGPTNDSSYWPWVQAAPNGQMFMAGPDKGMRFLELEGQGENHELGNRPDDLVRTYGSYVTYDTGKMLIAGGANSVASCSTIDFNSINPVVQPADELNYGRRQFDMTLLADGTVFVNGGNDDGAVVYSAPGTLYVSELWSPQTETWQVAADHLISRQYHSTSMLIPDGRVVTAGQCGGPPCQRDAEIYYPPYLFAADGSPATRPNITSVQKSWAYAESININNDANNIERAHLIKLGAVTHATNFEQRLVPLTINANQANVINVTAPSGGNIAPPGHYMLFLVNTAGVPSVAEVVHIGGDYGQDDSVSFTAANYNIDIYQELQSANNLALGASVSQSSTSYGGIASRANDGNTNGVYANNSVTHTASEATPWWQVDLGNNNTVKAINLYNRTDNCCTSRLSNVYVFVSETDLTGRSFSDIIADNSVWRHHIAGQAANKTQISINADGRYVRIQLAGTGILSLAEVEVLGSAPSAPLDLDSDGDGVPDREDALPNDPSESVDTDGDGVADNKGAFPENQHETLDSDGDGIGNNADPTPNGENITSTAFSLGNDTSADGSFIDGHHPSLYINEQDTYTYNNGDAFIQLDKFSFYARKLGNPITPIVVKVNDDNDFTVIAIGDTRYQDDYLIGQNQFNFSDLGTMALSLSTGDTIAIGFIDASPNGSGWGAGTVIPAVADGGADQDEIYGLLPSPLVDATKGFVAGIDTAKAVKNQKIANTNAGKNVSVFNLRRNYKFAISFKENVSNDDVVTPNPQPSAGQCHRSENLASKGSASQSSGYGGALNIFPANNAIDGNLNNFTHTDTADSNANWQLTFSQDYQFEQIVLHNRGASSRLRDITVSIVNNDGSSVYQSSLLNPENNLNSPTQISLDLVALTGGSVTGAQIVINRAPDPDLSGGAGNTDEANVLSLAEVEVHGCDLPPAISSTNIALGKTVSQSSTTHGGIASRAIDGNTNSIWINGSMTHTASQANPWWQLDLGANTQVGEIKLFNRTDCCSERLSDVYVFVSQTDLTGRSYADIVADNSVWRAQISGQADVQETISALTAGRYVRVQLAGDGPLSLAEVQIFPIADGQAPTPEPVSDALVLYGHPNEAGPSWTLAPGDYNVAQLSASPVGNNNASSFTLKAGYQVEICDQADFSGECRTFTSSVASLVAESFDDKATSIRVSKPALQIQNCAAGANNLLVNGSFEQTSHPDYNSAAALINALGTPNSNGAFADAYPQANIPGWVMTGGIPLQQGGVSQGGTIELGTSGFLNINAADGQVFVEMDGNVHNQIVQVVPGSRLAWQLSHRGREGIDTISLSIGPIGQQTIFNNLASGNNNWVEHSGTYNVPVGVSQIQLSITPESAANGDIDSSNLLDNIRLCVTN